MMVSGIVDVFMGVCGSWLVMSNWVYQWGNDNFAENWLEGVDMCQDDSCEIISLIRPPIQKL